MKQLFLAMTLVLATTSHAQQPAQNEIAQLYISEQISESYISALRGLQLYDEFLAMTPPQQREFLSVYITSSLSGAEAVERDLQAKLDVSRSRKALIDSYTGNPNP